MANLREAYDYAKNNPNSDFAKELQASLASGVLDTEAQKYGIDTSVFKPKPVEPKPVEQKPSLGSSIVSAVADPISKIGGSVAKTLLPASMEGSLSGGQTQGVMGNNVNLVGFKDGQRMSGIDTAKDVVGTVAQGASYLPLGSAVVGAGKSVLSRQIPKFLTLAKQGGISGGLYEGGESLQQGDGVGQALMEGAGGAIGGAVTAPLIGVPLGAAGAKALKTVDMVTKPLDTFKSDVVKNINKALSIQGKKSIGQAVNVAPEKRYNAFETMYDLSPEIKVKDEFGQDVAFSPKDANFQQFGEALYKAKNNLWGKVENLSKQATQKGVEVDITPALDDINKLLTDKGVPVDVQRKALELSDELSSFVSENGTVPLEALMRYNSFLNKKITGQLQGTSNNALREVEAITAKNLSESVDSAMESLAGKEFGKLKDQYSSLKAIENDTVRRMQQELRMLDTGLADFMGQYGTTEMIGGLIQAAQGNPASLVKGLSTKVVADYMKTLRQPSKYLRDAFNQIDNYKKGKGVTPFLEEVKKNSKLNKGMINFSEWIPDLKAQVKSAESSLSVGEKVIIAEDLGSTLSKMGINVGPVTKKNVDDVIERAKKAISDERVIAKKEAMSTPTVKRMEARFNK